MTGKQINSVRLCSLQCGHTTYFRTPPKIGDTVYCRRCTVYSRVVTSELEWSWNCPRCHYTKRHGTDRRAAIRAASRHCRKWTHVVTVKKGDRTIEVIGPNSAQLTMNTT